MKIFKPKREINVFSATTLGMGALIGAGIFVLAGPALESAGANVIFVYLLAGVSALLGAFTYSELASTYLEPGNEYAFGKNVMGDRFAFMIAWLLISGSTVACAVYALGFAEFVASWLSVPVSFLAVGISLLVCAINIVGVKNTAKLEYYFTIVLAAALLLFGGFLLTKGDVAQFDFSFSTKGIQDIIVGVNLVYISFFGFQVISSATEEIQEPRKNIPRAIFASLLISIVVYLVIIAGLVGVVPKGVIENPSLILETVANSTIGRYGAIGIVLLGIIATLTSLNATVLAVSRRVYGVAKDRYIPELLAQIHPRFRTPHFALIFILVLVSLLIVFGDLRWASNLSAFCYISSLILVHVIVLFSRKKHHLFERGYKMPLFPFIPILGILINVGFLFWMNPEVLVTGLGWTGLGIVLFALLKRREEGIKKVRLLFLRVKGKVRDVWGK